jgi:hypothetical protein
MPMLAVGIKELHFCIHDVGCFDAVARLKCLVDDLPRLQILYPDAIERLSLARFDELVLHDDAGIRVDYDPQTGSKFISAVTGHFSSVLPSADGSN